MSSLHYIWVRGKFSGVVGMQTAMTNLADGDKRLWVHLISVYVISWYIYKVSTSTHACLTLLVCHTIICITARVATVCCSNAQLGLWCCVTGKGWKARVMMIETSMTTCHSLSIVSVGARACASLPQCSPPLPVYHMTKCMDATLQNFPAAWHKLVLLYLSAVAVALQQGGGGTAHSVPDENQGRRREPHCAGHRYTCP